MEKTVMGDEAKAPEVGAQKEIGTSKLENGMVIVENEGTFKFRGFVTKIEQAGYSSTFSELYQLSTSYESMKKEFTETRDEKTKTAKERLDAVGALSDLDRMFNERSLPIFEKVLADLTTRQVSGTPVNDLSISDLTAVAGLYLQAQMLTEQERKN